MSEEKITLTMSYYVHEFHSIWNGLYYHCTMKPSPCKDSNASKVNSI